MQTIDFNRNNLDKANSPYLRQHRDNPIHWQEWKKEVLDYAQKMGKPIFVSVGYATCHWCHVMAKEAFSDSSVADFLNKNFVSIKVDREQRPDIDGHFMNFLTETQGSGGWPMNVVLTPDQKPFFAGTYFPPEPAFGRPGFKQVVRQVYDWYTKNSQDVKPYTPGGEFDTEVEVESEKVLLDAIKNRFDGEYGGWGEGAKFPPYNTLIFLLNYFAEYPSEDTKNMITKTLDRMAKGGLYDHLQGGFFRYCVDRQWRIPHFEKMLYDQAMLLWAYSLVYKIFGESLYKDVAQGIISSLDNVFVSNDLYYSATDADTNHKEGETYLWSQDEIKEILSETEWKDFKDVYDLSEENKLEGKLHLVKKTNKFLPDIERKLLEIRSKRVQPDKDRKIITSWNALLGIAFLIAGRFFKNDSYKKRGLNLYQRLITAHFNSETLAHSSFEDHLQKQSFLEDYASTLLLSTYVYEEHFTNLETVKKLRSKLMEYSKEGKWMESIEDGDFQPVAASFFDHPTPSSISLAEEALRRSALILGEVDGRSLKYKQPLSGDFYNLVVFYKLGNFHEIHSKEGLNYLSLPINSIQLKGQEYQDCYKMECRRFENQKTLFDALNKRVFFTIE
ncbi:MAG: thioredoxin domain-containing protein [Candidatus Levybacteria bacterium]|nr:thioredoxin domain-containing protein [Candidatus Levybacteria bacterium]